MKVLLTGGAGNIGSHALPELVARGHTVRSFERQFLADLLKRNHGHMGRAAREAGVDRKTIERMVKRHGLRGLR